MRGDCWRGNRRRDIYGTQVYRNFQYTGWSWDTFTNICTDEIIFGAISGAVGGGVGHIFGPIAAAARSSGLLGSLVWGAVEGMAGDAATHVLVSGVLGRNITPQTLASAGMGGMLAGGVGGGLGWTGRQAFNRLRLGLQAFSKSGILPWHAIRLSDYAQETGQTLAFRSTRKMSGIWNVLGVPAKPRKWGIQSDGSAIKTNLFGWAFSRDFRPNLIRGDYDLAFILDRTGRQLTVDGETDELLRAINRAMTGRDELTQVMHQSHWVYEDAASLGVPKDGIFIFMPDRTTLAVPHEATTIMAEDFGLRWPFKEWIK